MYTKLKIANFKSIVDLEVDLGRFNVFIGENGCGKTNILEAVALLSAADTGNLSPEELINKGVRVSKPSLMTSSFIGQKKDLDISIDLLLDKETNSTKLYTDSIDDIYTHWKDRIKDKIEEDANKMLKELSERLHEEKGKERKDPAIFFKDIFKYLDVINDNQHKKTFHDFVIYSLNTNSLRGITSLSKRMPVGIYGEGFDTLIKTFSNKEKENLSNVMESINWLKDIIIDEELELRSQEHSLGRSNSILYFTDKYMQRGRKLFSAENANEGILYLLFYFTLFISEKTPGFFAIDNIETALNPKLCRDLTKELARLAKENNKQTLITTHNPAILDGLNLHDDEQRLFVVKRSDEGHTKVERVKLKPKTKATEGLKLSELWMRGHLGGLPQKGF
jgi:predicted ATPase